MLKQRIVTALILLPLVLTAIVYSNEMSFRCLVTLVMLLAAWEWAGLIPLQALVSQCAYLLLTLALIISMQYLGSSPFLSTAIVLWLAAIFLIILYPRAVFLWGAQSIIAVLGMLMLAACCGALWTLKQLSLDGAYVIYVLVLIWAADTGAYFSGKLWGKNKLLPRVSPGKTWQGLVGGIFLAECVILLGAQWFEVVGVESLTLWVIIGTVTALVSVVGDLFISMLKRHTGVKDSGHLLPGHGGILDRIDSLIAASVFFVVMFKCFW